MQSQVHCLPKCESFVPNRVYHQRDIFLEQITYCLESNYFFFLQRLAFVANTRVSDGFNE